MGPEVASAKVLSVLLLHLYFALHFMCQAYSRSGGKSHGITNIRCFVV